jgi:predicted ATPase
MVVPTSRIPFVGRVAELAALDDGLVASLGGRGSVALVAGEPGAGKTRLAQEFSKRAEAGGAAVLWGRCYEGEGAPAYWPWVELFRAYLRTREPDVLRAELGVGAIDIAQLVPEVGERVPDLPPLPVLEPAQARFRLFDHLATFVGRAVAARPLVFILDDLHWADLPSLLLLEFLARDLESSRLLVVGTYRDVEVGRDHPLTNTLAELSRRAHVARLRLAGLTLAEAGRVIEHATGMRPSARRAEAILEETEGNPLFVVETARLLAAEERLTRAPAAGERRTVPDTVRGVIGRRLSRLTQECLRALTVAAAIGREFNVGLLGRASEIDAEAVLGILEEAEATSLIAAVADAPGRWRFSHALIRETLYDSVPATLCAQLHRQVGEALEVWDAAGAEPQSAELAHHFGAASVLGRGYAEKAVRYSRLAAERAERITAWEESTRHYERCLSLMSDAGDAFSEVEAALLTALGR